MKQANSRSADLRGFRWSLGAVERQREHHVDLARAQLALREREHQEQARQLDLLRAGREQQLPHAAALRGGVIDLGLRGHAVRHLRQSLMRELACEQEMGRLQSRVQQAQGSCASAQQRLDAACQLRERALALYVREQARREAREADLAWLACRGSGVARRRDAEVPR